MRERFQTFTVLVAEAIRCVRKIKTEEMADFDLKSPHVSCLYYLYKEGALTAKALSDICEEDKAAISRSLEYLEEKGYVICECSLKKRYNSPLKLTEKGEETGKWIANKIDDVVAMAGEGLSDEERRIFYKSFALICGNLQKICNSYGE